MYHTNCGMYCRFPCMMLGFVGASLNFLKLGLTFIFTLAHGKTGDSKYILNLKAFHFLNKLFHSAKIDSKYNNPQINLKAHSN